LSIVRLYHAKTLQVFHVRSKHFCLSFVSITQKNLAGFSRALKTLLSIVRLYHAKNLAGFPRALKTLLSIVRLYHAKNLAGFPRALTISHG